MTGRPNILWISTHDINPHLGAYADVPVWLKACRLGYRDSPEILKEWTA